MSGRHRRRAIPRVPGKRLLGAGATGVAAVFALMPLAHADTPEVSTSDTSADPSSDAPSSDAPSSDAPSSDAPSSDAPSSDAPSSDAPSSDAPSSDAPSSDAPSSDAPSSGAPSSDASTRDAAPKKSAKLKAAVEPDYGTRKVQVGVQMKDGSYAPNGTAGSVITIHETGPNAPGTDFTCTTAAGPTNQSSSCPGDQLFGIYTVAEGDTATVTQTSAPADTVPDPQSQSLGLCLRNPDIPDPPFPSCASTITFTDTGVPPEAGDDGPYTVRTGESIVLPVSGNDDAHGAPAEVDVQQPTHGTVTVQPGATTASTHVLATAVPGSYALVYTPHAGYVGADPFRYTLTTANGSDSAAVSVRVVAPPPTAKNDTAATTEGTAVAVDVTGNDNAHGGGTLAVDSVGDPKHGTTRVDGTTVVYTPADGFTGTDTFTYTVATAYGTDTATVTVTVAAAAAAPDNDTANLADTGVPTGTLIDASGALLLAGAAMTAVGRRGRRYRGRHA